MAILEVHDLRVRYPRAPRPALDGVSFQVEQGETVLLLGPSGSGKSTIGLCLAGLIPSSVPAIVEGTILFQGRDAAGMSVGERTAQVGMVFQDPDAQFCMLTVEDEVAFGLENIGMPREEMRRRVAESLELVGLADRRRARVDQLSGGQKQRLALACALARRPPVLFLDEPTANLDPAARWDFFQWLRELRRLHPETTILIVEHILDDLMAMVDRVVLLDHAGHVALAGRPRQVFGAEGDIVDAMGIWLPQVTALARRLRAAGFPLGALPLSVDEAEAALRPFLPLRPPLRILTSSTPTAPRRGATPALSARDLSFAYSPERLVLDHVNLDIPQGAFAAMAGPNGAGKTTLAAHFVDILRPPPETIRLFGDDITALSTADITARVGFVFQNPEHQFVERTVEDELAYSLRVRRRPPDEIAAVVGALLEEFGLEAYRRQNPFSLSQGQKRRLSVATMLSVGQRALILDEPTFGQDRSTAHALMERLKALHQAGVTLLAITHDMQLVADYAEEVIVLLDGRVAFQGAPADLFADDELTQRASLRPTPLHTLARRLGIADEHGRAPATLRDWMAMLTTAAAGTGEGYGRLV